MIRCGPIKHIRGISLFFVRVYMKTRIIKSLILTPLFLALGYFNAYNFITPKDTGKKVEQTGEFANSFDALIPFKIFKQKVTGMTASISHIKVTNPAKTKIAAKQAKTIPITAPTPSNPVKNTGANSVFKEPKTSEGRSDDSDNTTSRPAPTPPPDPSPEPSPTPVPTPTPIPNPNPNPQPSPIPTPTPQPDPVPKPKPKPKPQDTCEKKGGYRNLQCRYYLLVRQGRIKTTQNALLDVRKGRVHARTLGTAVRIGEYAKSRNIYIKIKCFKTGHGKYARPGAVSWHWHGMAFDIDNERSAWVLMSWLYKNNNSLKINELIFDNSLIRKNSNYYNLKHGNRFQYSERTLRAHRDHIHISTY